MPWARFGRAVRRLARRAGKEPRGRWPGVAANALVLTQEAIGADRFVWLLNRHPGVRIVPVDLAEVVEAGEPVRAYHERLSASAGGAPSVLGARARIELGIDTRALEAVVHQIRPYLIHVSHENVVRATLFREAVLRSPAWLDDWRDAIVHERLTPPPLRGSPLPFDPQRFTSTLRQIEIEQAQLRRLVDGLDLASQGLTEDELLDAEPSVMDRIRGDLGIEPTIEYAPIGRADERYLEVYEDLEALRSHLEETPYRPMLEDLAVATR